MKKALLLGVSILLMVMHPTEAVQAQSDDDLYIFGFSQTLFNSKRLDYSAFPVPAINPTNGVDAPVSFGRRSSSFALHQVNLFFRKNINERTTFFLNLEASGSFSTLIPSGNLEIPEGWLSYRFNDHLELKVGLLLPKFNNLNEINNRLPLFPYLIRPLIYESLLGNLFNSEDFRPRNAYFQISGVYPIGSRFGIDYAFYIGNNEESFLSPVPAGGSGDLEETSALYLGENLNTSLAYGGRIGIQDIFGNFKLGVSGTLDEDNKTDPESSILRLPAFTTPVLGEVPRYRLGIDFSFTYNKLSFETEYLGIFHDHSEIRRTPAFRNANLNKLFHYSNLTYNLTEKYYLFGFYSISTDNTYEFVVPDSPDAAGIRALSGGAGWKPTDDLVVKGQVMRAFNNRTNPHLEYSIYFFTLGVSVIF